MRPACIIASLQSVLMEIGVEVGGPGEKVSLSSPGWLQMLRSPPSACQVLRLLVRPTT